MSFFKVLYSIFRNPVSLSFILVFTGYLSLSFLGIENKTIRILTIILSCIILYNNISFRSCITNDKIFKNILYFVLFCFPSIFFTDDLFGCSFKLLEIQLLIPFIIVGVSRFNITNKFTIFHFFIIYYIIQTFITFLGYLFDPSVVAEDNNYGTYVTFLSCKYPPLHANGLGSFCAVSLMASTTFFILKIKNKLNIKILLYIFLIIISIITLYLTSSRTSMISGLIALLFFIYKTFPQKYKLLLTIIVITFCFTNSKVIESSITSILMKKQTEETIAASDSSEADVLASGRLSIWSKIIENPEKCILGQGYGTAFKTENIKKFGVTNAHNSIMELLYNVGIFACFFWLRLWYILYKRYKWLIKFKKLLPLPIEFYHLSMSLLILNFIRSFANISFVYMQLDVFSTIGVIILFIYSKNIILNSIKNEKLQL